MSKWLNTRVRRGHGWEIVNFTGPTGRHSRGVVDFLAIRKDHRALTVPRGNYLEIIVIQVNGGSAPRPAKEDIKRLRKVQRRHNARAVVLADWEGRAQPTLYELLPSAASSTRGEMWRKRKPAELFR